MKKKILIGVPERMLDQLDLLAQHRSQSRSELIREIFRNYIEQSQTFSPARPAISLIHPSLHREEIAAAQ